MFDLKPGDKVQLNNVPEPNKAEIMVVDSKPVLENGVLLVPCRSAGRFGDTIIAKLPADQLTKVS